MQAEKISASFEKVLQGWGVRPHTAESLNVAILVVCLACVALLANFLTKKIIVRVVTRLIERSKNTYDDVFLENRVFSRLSHLVPGLIFYYGIAWAFDDQRLVQVIQSMAYIYMVIVLLVVAQSFVNAMAEIFQKVVENRHKDDKSGSRESMDHEETALSISGYLHTLRQMLNIVVISVAGSLIFSALNGQSPGKLLTGLGALAAVLMLVFKDTILGFVASIQLSAYRMVKRGDWISMPSRGADGDVLDISLSTVKVQNFDKTISTIPTYALVSESFTNWKGMQHAGGRRIKRAVHIDINSVRFCDQALLDRFKQIHILRPYILHKENELAQHNQAAGIEVGGSLVNRARLTNLGTFRKYLELFLRQNNQLHDGFTFLVRQLAPGETGIPIEIYVFTRTTSWPEYEDIQADIFDHILASVNEFDLNVFQNPTGSDFRVLRDPR